MLEEITSCSVRTTREPMLLSFGVVAVVVGVACFWMPCMVFGMLLMAAYWAMRRESLRITSRGGSINCRLNGISMAIAIEFIDAVEAAKNERFLNRAALSDS